MKKTTIQYVLMAIPYLLGASGLLASGEGITNALFGALCMYFLNYGGTPANIAIELARWLAPLATASWILMLIARARKSIRDRLCYYRGNSVAVYGDPEQRRKFMTELGSHGIDAGEDWSLIPAQDYLLVGSEEENLAFYCKNQEPLSGHTVYLRARSLRPQSATDANLRLFCPEETAARLYWRQNDLYETLRSNANSLKVIIIGFGALGENLINYALLDNVYDPGQRIEYHVFGDCREYLAVHTQLAEIQDPIIYHEEPWYQSLELLGESQRIIVLPQEEQIRTIQELLLATHISRIDVFVSNTEVSELLDDHDRIWPFLWEREGENPENIFGTAMYDQAMALNLYYEHQYSGIEMTPENSSALWGKLNGFTRYSNVSAADYHEIRHLMMDKMGWPTEVDALSAEQIDFLSHLEHIRWCRYHLLNNWHYGIPANGANKDPDARIHVDLKPYEQLTAEEQQKDINNVKLLLGFRKA